MSQVDCSPEPLSALTFNLKVGVDSSPAVIARDLLRIERERGALHLTSLQEVGRCWQMGVPVHQAAYLASCLQHKGCHFGAALTDRQGGEFGVAATAQQPFESAQSLLLPRARDEQRTLQKLTLTPKGWRAPLHVLITHLSIYEQEREAQAALIADEVSAVSGPLLLLGDLNDLPQSATLERLLSVGLEDHWGAFYGDELGYSFSVKQPNRRIDYLLSRGLTCLELALLTEVKSSDHFPLWGRFVPTQVSS